MSVKKAIEKKTPYGAAKVIAREIKLKRSKHSPAGKSYLRSIDSSIDKAKATKYNKDEATRKKKELTPVKVSKAFIRKLTGK